jgi:hypothetical protein
MRRLTITLLTSSLLNLFGCSGQEKKTTNDEILQSVEDYQNRPIHETLTSEILSKVKDEDLEQAIFDNIAAKMDDGSEEREIVESLTPGQRAIYVTMIVEGEVSNGGFNQFYYNPSGQVADLMEEAFKTIEARPFADLATQANSIYAGIKEDLEKYKDGTMESFSKSYDNNPLNELDDKFYKLNEHESLSQIRIQYIRNNVKEFVTN